MGDVVKTGRIYLLFILTVIYLEQCIIGSVRYSRNPALDGFGCQYDDVVFHESTIINKILCSSLCSKHKICVGFFYILTLQECIGCRANFQNRTTTMMGTEYYTRDGLRNSSAFDGLRCITDERISVHFNISTLAHCASTCFANDDCQSYFHQHETQQCCLCRLAYGINGDNAGFDQWPGSLYESRYGYLGCFEDQLPRIIEGEFTLLDFMTTEMCIYRCISKGHIYALTEASNNCGCGNQLTSRGNYTDENCNMPCQGDESQVCGNLWTASTYILRHW